MSAHVVQIYSYPVPTYGNTYTASLRIGNGGIIRKYPILNLPAEAIPMVLGYL